MGLQIPVEAKNYCGSVDTGRQNQKEQRKGAEEQRAITAMQKASARRALEMEMRMNLLPAMAVFSDALEEQILSEVTNTPVKKRK